MKKLIIIGARGFGREVFSLATRSIGYNEEFSIKGFLDSKSDVLDEFENYPPIIGSVEDYEIQEDDVFVCALGSVKWKKHYIEIILEKGGQFINIIEKSVRMGENVSLGKGCIICEYSVINNDAVIDDYVSIHSHSLFGHDVVVGKYSHIGAHCFFGGYAKVREEVTVYVRSTILDRLEIEKGATVGAGSLVVKKVKSETTVFGNPAVKIFG